MYFYNYYLLPQKGGVRSIFPDQSEALGCAIAPIATSIGRSAALIKSYCNLPHGNSAAASDILDKNLANANFFFRIIENIQQATKDERNLEL